MKRLFIFTVLLLFAAAGIAATPPLARTVKGRVTAENSPLEGVVVSDGENFAVTDSKGAFSLTVGEKAPFVFVVTPSGYSAPCQEGFPVFYQPVDGRRCPYEFRLERLASSEGYELLAVGDPQPQTEEHMSRLSAEIMPELQKVAEDCRSRNDLPEVGIILGDVVWDRMYLMPEVKREFSKLGIPFYTVIGNHDHDLACDNDFDSTHAYRDNFGPTYYAFNLGDTYFIVLDDIEYYGSKEYDERVNDAQLAWVEKYVRFIPEGARVCVAMHAPAMKYWRGNLQLASNRRLLKLLAGREVHFLTGHTHINSNYDVVPGVVEHNVGQINGNLWHAPLNSDGSTKGVCIITETGGQWHWLYRSLGHDDDYQMRIWLPGELKAHKDFVVAKIWGWDPRWTVVWYEDGHYRGAMEQVSMNCPDYMAFVDTAKVTSRVKTNLLNTARSTEFYFRARPSRGAHEMRIVATDRNGREFVERIALQ